MKKFLLLVSALLLLTASSASALLVDVDGLSGTGTTYDITKWDWAPSTAVAVGGNGISIGDTFDMFTFGTLSSVFTGQSNIGDASLFGANKEITFVTGFTENVIDLSGTPNVSQTAVFTAQAGGFFEVYIDDMNADNDLSDGVAGGGFNDGDLLFSGTITSGTGSFSSIYLNSSALDTIDGGTDGVIDDASATDAFNNGASPLNPQLSVTGNGGSTINTIVKFDQFNPNYFIDVTSPLWYKFSTQTQNNLPFTQVDPSNKYWDGNTLQDVKIGIINGAPGNGPDVIFETDASTTDAGAVPEPATLLLLGIGLLGFGVVARRKQS